MRASTFFWAVSIAFEIQRWVSASPCSRLVVHQPGEHRLRAEDAQQVVVEAQVEFGQAGVALAARAAAQLIVDAPALVALGAEYVEPAELEHALLLRLDFGTDLFRLGVIFGRAGDEVRKLVEHPEIEVAAELDVGAAPGHVGRDRHRADAPGLGDDMRLLLVKAGVEHRMLDPLLLEEFGQHLRLFDRHGADQHRLAEFLLGLELLGDRPELLGQGLVEDVLLVGPQDRHVGRDRDHVHLVDVEEFRRLGRRRAGHARELRVHPEIVLEGDRGQRLVLGLDRHSFLGLDRLVEAVRPAPPVHHPAGELVDDDDLAVLDDVIDVLAGTSCWP